MKATERLINKVWTLEFEKVSETEIKILNFSREDLDGYKNETAYPRLSLHEDNRRNVLGVYLMPYEPFACWADVNKFECFKVINPDYVFNYCR